jgi:hypothetical protein
MAEPRTDVGTFLFRIPSPVDGAKVTVEYANSSESVVFFLFHHGPNRQAAVQLSGQLLEIEANEELLREVWQTEEHDQVGKRWERDRRCMGCAQERERFFHVCKRCIIKAFEGAFGTAPK